MKRKIVCLMAAIMCFAAFSSLSMFFCVTSDLSGVFSQAVIAKHIIAAIRQTIFRFIN